MLANRFQQIITSFIHNDQVGFTSGQRWFNTCKSINIIYHIKRTKDKNFSLVNRCRKSFQNLWHHITPVVNHKGTVRLKIH